MSSYLHRAAADPDQAWAGRLAPRCISRPSRYAGMRSAGGSRRSSPRVCTWRGISTRSAEVTTDAGNAAVCGLDGGGAAVAAFQARAALAAARMSASVEASPRSEAGTPVSPDSLSRRFSASNCPMRRSFSAARSSSVMWTPFVAITCRLGSRAALSRPTSGLEAAARQHLSRWRVRDP